MNARGALDSYIESLQILARTGTEDRSDGEREADAQHRSKLIDGYAHQLAEQQREDVDLAAHPGESVYPCEDCAVVRAAASIDPQASARRSRRK